MVGTKLDTVSQGQVGTSQGINMFRLRPLPASIRRCETPGQSGKCPAFLGTFDCPRRVLWLPVAVQADSAFFLHHIGTHSFALGWGSWPFPVLLNYRIHSLHFQSPPRPAQSPYLCSYILVYKMIVATGDRKIQTEGSQVDAGAH